MKKIYILAISLLFILTAQAQAPDWVWAKSPLGSGSESASSVATDVSNNVYVTGSFTSATVLFGTTTLTNGGSSDIYIAKYDPSGNVLWAIKGGGSGSDVSFGIAADAAGGVYITGYYTGATITFGTTTLNSAGSWDIFLAKYNSAGVFQWAKTIGGTGADQGYGIATDANNDVYITGNFFSGTMALSVGNLTNATTSTSDMFVIKYNSIGTIQWAKSAGSNGSEEGYGITADASGNIYAVGVYTSTNVTFGSTTLTNSTFLSRDIYLTKYDALTGTVTWAKTSGGTNQDYAYNVKADSNGDVYITGYFTSTTATFGGVSIANAGGNTRLFTVKYNSAGISQWAKSPTSTGSAVGSAIALDYQNNVFVTGYYRDVSVNFDGTILSNFNQFGADNDIFVVKYNSSGVQQWVRGDGNESDEGGSGISVDLNGNIYVVGSFDGGIYLGSIPVNGNGNGDMFIGKLPTCIPIMTNISSANICSGNVISIPLTSSLASSYSWIANNNSNTTGESLTTQTATTISNTLVNLSSNSQTVTYTVTPTSIVGGCIGPAQTISVAVNPLPNVTSIVSPSASVCSGQSITLTGLGATSYTWTGGATNGVSFVPVSTTTYTVTGTLAGCTNTATQSITVNPNGNSSFTYPLSTYCQTGSNPTPTVTVSGGVFSYTPSGLSINSSTGTINLGLSTLGTYQVTYTNAASGLCATSTSKSITVTSSPNATFSYTATPYCQGVNNPSPTFAIGSSAGIFTASPSGLVFISNTTGQVNLSASTPGNYTVTNSIAAGGGCAAASASSSIVVKQSPALTSTSAAAVCSGGTVSISLVSDIASTYQWSAVDNGNTIGESTTVQTAATLSNTITLTSINGTIVSYYVTPTANGCTGTIQQINVTVNPVPSMTNLNPQTLCSGGAVSMPLSSNIFATYSWIAANNTNTSGESTTAKSTTTINDIITNSTNSPQDVVYTVTPTSGTCIGAALTVIATINPKPIMSNVSTDVICSDGTVNIPLTSLIASTYSWKAANNSFTTGESTNLQNSNLLNNTITNNSTVAQDVVYTVTPTSTASVGCQGTTQTITITVNPKPTMTSSSAQTICSGTDVTIPLQSDVAASYTWIAANNSSTIGESTTLQYTNTLSNTIINQAGTIKIVNYTVTPTSNLGSCEGDQQSIAVTVKPLDDASFSYPSSTFCQSGANPTPSVNVQGVFSYHPLGLSINSSTGTINLASSNLGTYTLIHATAGSSITCSNKDSITITITSAFNATFSYAGTTYCQGANNPLPTFTGSGSAGAFSSTAGLQFANINTGEINLTTSTPGPYTVTNTIAAANGCSAAAANFNIVINPAPTMQSTATAQVCSGSAVTITLSSTISNSTYKWVASNNPNTSGQNLTPITSSTLKDTITNTTNGAENIYYSVTPTAIIGACIGAPQTITVTVNPLPIVSFTGLVNNVCLNSSPQSLIGTPSGNGGIFSITGGNGISGNSYTPLLAGVGTHTITYTYTDANMCTDAYSQSNTVLPKPIAPEICEVTVDSVNYNHNIIYWERGSYHNVRTFFVLREISTNNYSIIDSVPASSPGVYEDFAADPNTQGYRYKLKVIDTCNNFSDEDKYHNTIWLNYLGLGILSWTPYSIESNPNPVLNYNVYRDNTGTGPFQVIGTPTGNQTGFTDNDYALYPNARYRVDVDWSRSCDPTLRTTASISTTRSNIKNRTAVGIKNNATLIMQISIVPNPANEQITINTAANLQITSIQIFDLTGREVHHSFVTPSRVEGHTTIDVHTLAPAIYTITLRGKDFVVNKKLVISE